MTKPQTVTRQEQLVKILDELDCFSSVSKTEIISVLGRVPNWLKDKNLGIKSRVAGEDVYDFEPLLKSLVTNPNLVGSDVEVDELEIPAVNPVSATTPVAEPALAPNVLPSNVIANVEAVIPEVMKNYVPFGHYKDISGIIKSKMFFPIFVTGLSGNGKTLMIDQICAKLKRELLRVNITIETDEDDLIGGNTLINGNVVYREGPVITAMRNGSILLLDEVDLGSNKLMCLQSVLEGKGVFIKKTGEWVHPQPGFNVIATANTKGQGSDDGKFVGTQIMNEAMIERFAICVEQEYPPLATERKILQKEMELTGDVDNDFVDNLVTWADIIRKTFYDGGIDDVITTRRLVHIVNAYRMFGDRIKSISMCVSRFDDETQSTIIDLYTKIDADAEADARTDRWSKAGAVLEPVCDESW